MKWEKATGRHEILNISSQGLGHLTPLARESLPILNAMMNSSSPNLSPERGVLGDTERLKIRVECMDVWREPIPPNRRALGSP